MTKPADTLPDDVSRLKGIISEQLLHQQRYEEEIAQYHADLTRHRQETHQYHEELARHRSELQHKEEELARARAYAERLEEMVRLLRH